MINHIKIRQFAGIRDREVHFEKGLNVIMGPNESGKSTIVEFIYSMLFQSHRILKNKVKDRSFVNKAMRYPDGDFAGGELHFNSGGSTFVLKKEWSFEKPFIEMEKDGEIIRDQSRIEKILSEIFCYGEGTYSSIFFAKQDDFKKIFIELKNNREAFADVSSFLNKATVELGGIKTQEYLDLLEKNISLYLSKWDIINNRPENNRGIENPYKKDKGEIISYYYEKEELLQQMAEVEKTEKLISLNNSNYLEIEKKLQEVSSSIEEAEKLESKAVNYSKINTELKYINEKISELQSLNNQWPRQEWEKESLEKALLILKEEEKNLIEMLKKIDEFEKKNWELQKKVEIFKSKIDALSFSGKIIKASEILKVYDAFGKEKKLGEGEEWISEGYTRIINEPNFEIEIKAGDIDYSEVKLGYLEASQKLADLLKESENIRNKKDVKNDLDEKVKVIRDKEFTLHRINNLLKDWSEKYEDHDKLLEKLVELMGRKKENETLMINIGELPESCSDIDNFLMELKKYRIQKDLLIQKKNDIKQIVEDLARSLPENSFEELREFQKDADIKYKNSLEKAKRLLKIREVFLETVSSLEENAKNPFLEKFIKNLSFITEGKYESAEIDNNLDIVLQGTERQLNLDILSSGTLDSVALAFRLAIIEEMTKEIDTITILDDCLVNMDTQRQKKAVELIKHHGDKYQVLFTTCNPETFNLLGGNQIQFY